MTPQFLRAEAARFREMAETVTDREASRQRLLNMALDYEARADAADAANPPAPEPEPQPAADPEPITESQAEPERPARLRLGRRTTLRAPRANPAP